MKTLGELRKLITDNDGVLEIGALKFTYKIGEDVDVKLDEWLVMWLSKNNPDATLLSGKNFSKTNDIDEMRQTVKEKSENFQNEKKAQETLMEAEKKLADAQNAIGKVEAYEKLLIGRDITISK